MTDSRAQVSEGKDIGSDTPEELTMALLLANIPLMVLFFALWAGIPLWLVARHPDTGPETAQTAAIAYLPAQHHDPACQQAA